MRSHSRWILLLCSLALSWGASGCSLSGNYHSAKTLSPGEAEFQPFNSNGLTLRSTDQ